MKLTDACGLGLTRIQLLSDETVSSPVGKDQEDEPYATNLLRQRT
jgi:hypothetical protein